MWLQLPHILKTNFLNLHFYQDSVKSSFCIKPLFFQLRWRKSICHWTWSSDVLPVEFIFSLCSVTVKLNLDKKGGKWNKTYARSSFFSANFISVVYGSGAHKQQKVKYKQLLNLTVSLGWKVVSTRHPQPWQKKRGRNNGFQGEMIGGCPINLQQESHWGIAMLFTSSFWYFTSCAPPITAMFVGAMVLILVHVGVLTTSLANCNHLDFPN